MTARILIALSMAAIGSILGFVLALRMARPHAEKQERVRTARGFGGASASSRDFPADEQEQQERSAEPERRRSLIAENQGPSESIFDDGPSFLTGMSPHILDVTKFDFDPIDQQPPEPEHPEPEHGAPALELDQFATVAPIPAPGFESIAAPQAVAEFAAAPLVQAAPPVQTVAAQADPVPAIQRAFAATAEPVVESFATPAAMPFSTPVLPVQAPQQEALLPEAQAEPAPEAFVAPVTSPLQFSVGGPAIGAAPSPVQAEATASPAAPAAIQETPAVSAETDDADPLAAFRNRIAPMPVFHDEPEDFAVPQASQAGIYGDLAADPEPAAEPVSVYSQLAPPMGAAAERLMNANLSDLSPVELIERLALSLQRRGQAITLARLPAAQPAPEPAVVAQPEPVAATVEAPAAAVEPEANPPGLTLPAAMRPIDFSQYEQDDHLPAYVPARSIAMPSSEAGDKAEQVEPQTPLAAAAPQENSAMPGFGRPAEVAEASSQTEDEVLEAGYSSLLDMSRPAGQRQQFVRVIDPEADTEAAEPVVIFPGQAMRAGTLFAAPSAGPVVAPTAPPPSLAEASGQPRRFDEPPAQSQSAAQRSPEETERALRSALSTLQRMSGAA